MTRWQEKSELSHLPYKPCLSRSLSFLGFFHQPLSPSFRGGGGGAMKIQRLISTLDAMRSFVIVLKMALLLNSVFRLANCFCRLNF